MPKTITDFIHRLFDFVDTCKQTGYSVKINICREVADLNRERRKLQDICESLRSISTGKDDIDEQLRDISYDIEDIESNIEECVVSIDESADELDDITDEKDLPDEKAFELLCLKENITL